MKNHYFSNKLYSYKGVDAAGDYVQGLISGGSLSHVKKRLEARQVRCFSLWRQWGMHTDSKNLSLFFLYLHYALSAGYPLLQALFMVQQAFKGVFSQIVSAIYDHLRQGALFSQACQEYPMIFPAPLITLIVLGEKAGQLSRSCQQACHYLEHIRQKRKSLGKALSYPILNFSFFMVTFIIMAYTLIPQVENFFSEGGKVMPLASQWLIFFTGTSAIIAALSFFLILLISIPWMPRLGFRWMGSLTTQSSYTQFFSGLALLVQEQVPLITALHLCLKQLEQSLISSFSFRCFYFIFQWYSLLFFWKKEKIYFKEKFHVSQNFPLSQIHISREKPFFSEDMKKNLSPYTDHQESHVYKQKNWAFHKKICFVYPIMGHLESFVHQVKEGKTLGGALHQLPHFSFFYAQLIQAGEKTGQQGQALQAAVDVMILDQKRVQEKIIFWSSPLLMIGVGLCFWLLIEGTFIPLYNELEIMSQQS